MSSDASPPPDQRQPMPDPHSAAGSSEPPETIVTDLAGDATAVTIGGDQQTMATQTPSARGDDLTMATRHPGAGDDAGQIAPGTIWSDDFEIVRKLGQGGMGAVYLARQLSLDRDVAIKVLPAHLSDNEGFRKRFALEARAVAKLNSPHVIQVFTAGQFQGHSFFVMEYVEGQDLSARIKAGYRPSHTEALDLVIQAAQGLAAAGDQDIIHRDIKPANMMVSADGSLKIMDFGLVKLAKADSGLTMAGTVMGTVSYFSPEQGRGEVCDARTDIYALGVVFYELLSGRLPFTGNDATSIIYQHIHEQPRPLQEIDPSIPEDLQAIVLKCMQKDPGHRYQDARSLVEDLTAVRHGASPVTAFHDPAQLRHGATVTRTPQFSREHRSPLLLVLVLVVLLGGGAAAWFTREHWLPVQPDVVSPDEPDAQVRVEPEEPTDADATSDDATAQHLEQAQAAQRLEQAQAALSSDDLERVAALLADADQDDPRWQAVAATLANRQAVRMAHGQAEETVRTARQLIQSGALDQALAKLEAVDLNALATSQRARIEDLIDRAKRVRQLLTVAAQGLAVDDLATARENFTQANTVIATDTARHGAQVVSQCLAVDRALADENVAQAQADLAVLAEIGADQLLIERRQHRFEALKAVLAVRAAIDAADPELARRHLALLAEHDSSNRHLADLRRQVGDMERDHLVRQHQRAFSAAMEAEDMEAARTALAALEEIDHGGPAWRAAQERLASSQMAQRQAAAQQAARQAQAQEAAQDLEQRIAAADTQGLARFEADLEELLAPFDEGGRERWAAALRRAIAARRDQLTIISGLEALDRHVLAADAESITALVHDAEHASALRTLSVQSGLTFAHHLLDLQQVADGYQARVAIRTGMDISPEQTLHYRYDYARHDGAWVITAVTLLPVDGDQP